MARRGPALFLGVGLSIAGCGGGGDVTVAEKQSAVQRPDVDQRMVHSGSTKLPEPTPFNVASFRSGQNGQARGESQAVGPDGATCRAEARTNGDAWAEFQLGYCFDNTSGSTLDAVVKLRLTVADSTPGEGGDGDPPAATSSRSLRFFIKDGLNGRTLRNDNLLASDARAGPRASTTTHDLVFDARLEPGHGYYLVLDGRAEVRAGAEDAPRKAALEVSRLVVEILWHGGARPAAAPSSPSRTPVLPASAPAGHP